MRTVGEWSRVPVGSSSVEGRQGGVGDQPPVVGGVQGEVGDSGEMGGFVFLGNKSRFEPAFRKNLQYASRVGLFVHDL